VWQKTKAGAGLSVINPASGPGTTADGNYVQTVNQLKAAQVLLMGYVSTSYGVRSEADVIADINRYGTLYGLTNIFLDEGSSSCDQLAYYQRIVSYIKSVTPTAVVALNWGVDGSECYLNSTNTPDILLNFENSYDEYLKWLGPPAWASKYPASRFWQLVHSAPPSPEAFYKAITLSKSRRAGWVYVTDDVMPNPWDALPAGPGLWELQVRLAKQPQQIGVPSYFSTCSTSSPNCIWVKVKGNAGMVILDVNNGPSTAANARLQQVANFLRSNSGTLMLGYVFSREGSRPAAQVRADIDRWFKWYPVAGIFIDDASSRCSKVGYYSQLVKYVKSKNSNALVAMYWGNNLPECYFASPDAPDIAVNFESSFNTYLNWKPDPWTSKYPAHRFWHWIHTAVGSAKLATALTLSATRRAGWVFVTSDKPADPWDTLPPYFNTQVAAVANNSFVTC
jgi:hypothetical protein